MKPKGFANLIIIIAAFVALSAIASTYLVLENQEERGVTPEPRFCTMEAKQCPDGSYVGRTGPNCEFSACPAATNSGACKEDSDCKLLYSGCGCIAAPQNSSQTSYNDGLVCIRNSCMPPTPVTAVCRQNKCVRSDQVQAAVDTSTWKTLVNKYGWSIKYPPSWQAAGIGDAAESSDGPIIDDNQGSGIQLDAMPGQASVISKMTPKQYLLSEPGGAVLEQQDVLLGGLSAYEVTILQKVGGVGGEVTQIMKTIAVNYNGKIFAASQWEGLKDQSQIKSVSDWKWNPLFNQILSTFKFISSASATEPLSFQVTSPQAGDKWVLGSTYTIRWTTPPASAPQVDTISLAPPRPACLDSVPRCMIAEVAPYVIADGAPDSGSYTWKIPANLSTPYVGGEQVTITVKEIGAVGRSGLFTVQGATAELPPAPLPPIQPNPAPY